MTEYLVYAAVGKLLIFLLQKFPPAKTIAERLKITKLYECDLCLGVWIYWFWAFIFRVNVFWFYIPVVSEFLTGCVTAFIVHLISLGWKSEFMVYEVK